MKKIVMIFAAMAAVLSSCQKNEPESVSAKDGRDIVLNISVSNPGAGDTKALVKSAWAVNDQIKIWFDANAGSAPDLVIKYDGSKWAGTATKVPTSASGTVKALYSDKVLFASKDTYTLSDNTLTFSIENWNFLTEIQVVVKGLWSDNASKYTLSCDKFTPLASTGNGYTVEADNITVSPGTKGTATKGIPNKDGIAFVFATADYSSSSSEKKDFEFTIKEESGIQQTYKPNVAIVAKDGKKSIKALTFANPNYVEIPADYDNDPSTPNTSLKWYRQNLAITDSGKKAWKGDNTSSTVKVPGTNEDVKVGDYFQWAAYENYSTTSQLQDRGLLLYTSFENKKCGDNNNKFYTDGGDFSKSFKKIYAPYGGTSYSKYNSSSPATLERTESVNDDVASIILGGDWRMPTSAEFKAMKEATYWAWDTTDFGYYVFLPDATHTAGAKASSIPSDLDKNGALLFFPEAGIGNSSSLTFGYGPDSAYWSSSLRTDNTTNAYRLLITPDYVDPQDRYSDRCDGYPVRPVSD